MNSSDKNLPPNVLSARIKFSDVVKRLEKIHNAKTIAEKSQIFKKFVEALKKLQEKFLAEEGSNADGSFFPFLRLFIPKSDTERDSYGIRTTTLGKLYVKALAINLNSDAAKKLTTQRGMISACVDYGDIVYEAMKGRSPENGSLMVYEINKYLDLIADHFRNNERNKIDTEMVHMLQGMTALDRKWLTRIILKKMNLRMGQQRILQLYNPDAAKYYNQYSHLSRLCQAIESGETLSAEGKSFIELFKPLRPMLCEHCKISQINRMLDQGEYYLETKMDGERFLVHVKDKEFKYFSRSCNDDFTQNFGSDCSGGLYSPQLYRLLNGKLKNVIFDGEMMVWNREEEIYQTKAENFTARNLRQDDPKLNTCFCVYDIIYLNDNCLVEKPYAERSRLLRQLITEQRGVLMLCERKKIRDSEHFLECLNNAFDANEEGVVIKQAESKYRPGIREKGGWFKIKPDYENNLINDFDLLVIGGFFNVRKTYINNLLLGVFKKNEDLLDSGVFYAVCRVRNGLTRSQFSTIRERLKPYWNKVRVSKDGRRTISHNPPCIEWNQAAPDVWIEPKHSIVLQIKASELVETSTFRTTHTFRFPRVIAVRDDKPWYDSCTLNEFQKFCSSNSKVEKLTKRHADLNDITEQLARKIPIRIKKAELLAPKLSAKILGDIKVIDNVCDGLEFCILNAEKGKQSIDDLKAMVLKHGGLIVENPGRLTFVCIAGQITKRVINMMNSEKYNIATAKWLTKALGSNEPLEKLEKFKPSEMIFSKHELRQQFSNDYDIYGDSFMEPVNYDEMNEFLKGMSKCDLPILTASELNEMEKELSQCDNAVNMFRLYTAYFYTDSPDTNVDLELAQFIFKTKAGHCLRSANEIRKSSTRLTHIFVENMDFDHNRLTAVIRSFETENIAEIKIITCQWILDCHRLNKKLCDEHYRIYLENC